MFSFLQAGPAGRYPGAHDRPAPGRAGSRRAVRAGDRLLRSRAVSPAVSESGEPFSSPSCLHLGIRRRPDPYCFSIARPGFFDTQQYPANGPCQCRRGRRESSALSRPRSAPRRRRFAGGTGALQSRRALTFSNGGRKDGRQANARAFGCRAPAHRSIVTILGSRIFSSGRAGPRTHARPACYRRDGVSNRSGRTRELAGCLGGRVGERRSRAAGAIICSKLQNIM